MQAVFSQVGAIAELEGLFECAAMTGLPPAKDGNAVSSRFHLVTMERDLGRSDHVGVKMLLTRGVPMSVFLVCLSR